MSAIRFSVSASAAVCALVMLSSCYLGPRYRRPTAATPPAYKELPPGNDEWKTASPSDGTLRGKWWEMFNDPQLNRLEDMVAVSNQTVLQYAAQFRVARALVGYNRAQFYPTVTTSPSITSSYGGGAGGSRTTILNGIPAGGTYTNVFQLPFSVSWEPNIWGQISLQVENAVASAQYNAALLQSMQLSLQGELASDYFFLQGEDMEERLLSSSIESYEKYLVLTINRFNGGVASKADVAQAQTQLETTRAQLTDLAATRATYEHAIAVLIGQPPSTFTISPGDILNPPPMIPTGVPSQLLERRPDIAAAERQVAAQNAFVGLARVAYYPTLSLSATAGLQGTSLLNWFTWPARFFSLGPAATQTLFDFGRRRAQEQEAVASYDADVANYRQTVLGAFQEVEDYLSTLRLLAIEAVQEQEAVRAAEESLTLETERYKAGTVTYLDVITSQNLALTSERTAVQILERRMNTAVLLIRALGGGWNASTLPNEDDMRRDLKTQPRSIQDTTMPPPPRMPATSQPSNGQPVPNQPQSAGPPKTPPVPVRPPTTPPDATPPQ